MSKTQGAMSTGANHVLKKKMEQKLAEAINTPRNRMENIGNMPNILLNQSQRTLNAINPNNLSGNASKLMDSSQSKLSEMLSRFNPTNFRESLDKSYDEMLNRRMTKNIKPIDKMISNYNADQEAKQNNEMFESIQNARANQNTNPVQESIGSLNQFSIDKDDINLPNFDELSIDARKFRTNEFLKRAKKRRF